MIFPCRCSINALTLLISIIVLADASKRNESVRLFAVFDLLDFSKGNSISFDELVGILFIAMQLWVGL
jgi:hypothetical protein